MIEDLISSSESTISLGHLPLSMRAERVLKNAYLEHPQEIVMLLMMNICF